MVCKGELLLLSTGRRKDPWTRFRGSRGCKVERATLKILRAEGG